MKIIITGVAGFIGSNLVKRLLELDHEVIGVDNMSYGESRNIKPFFINSKFSFINGDICNPNMLNGIKADIIVHLASQKIPRYSSALRTIDENYMMLKNIIDKCLRDNSKIVFASTSDVYGKNPIIPFHEESDLLLGPTTVKRWAYALSKMNGEHYIKACNEEFGLKYSIARFFGSYGPNHNLTWWGGPQSGFITKAIANEEIEIHGDGLQTRTFTFIYDTVEGLVNLILDDKANNEIFNIGTEEKAEISILGLARLVWELVNGKDDEPKLNFIPYSTFGKYEDVMRRVPDISKMKKTFDYIPKWELREGLLKTIEWQKKILDKL